MFKRIEGEYKKGDKIILLEQAKDTRTKVILCLWNGQYVTWIIINSENDFQDGNWGHYFGTDLVAAMGDFKERVEHV